MVKVKNYGFSVPKIDKTNYVSGDGRLLGASFLNPEGDWSSWLPKYEPQAENYETWGCVPFGATSQIETMIKYLYGEV